MRRTFLTLTLISPLAIAACAPTVPNSAAGVGFQDYDSYAAQRDAALNGAPAVAPGAQPIAGAGTVQGQVVGAPGTGFDPTRIGAAIDSASGSPAAPGAGAVIGGAGIPSTPPVPVTPSAPYAAAPVAPAAAAPVAPSALPTRAGGKPNLVQYALTTTNAVGQPVHDRSSLQLRDPAKVCAGYSSADQAQAAFLDSGGPAKDRKGLDPDGDGFACGWDPTPFRDAVR